LAGIFIAGIPRNGQIFGKEIVNVYLTYKPIGVNRKIFRTRETAIRGAAWIRAEKGMKILWKD
jgi:hypothetical protein